MLKAGFGWSDEELFDTFYYNVPVRYALGCRDVSEGHFEPRTLYNYRQRLTNHMQGTGENLSESRMQPDLHGCLLLVVFAHRPEKRHIPSLRVLKNKRGAVPSARPLLHTLAPAGTQYLPCAGGAGEECWQA